MTDKIMFQGNVGIVHTRNLSIYKVDTIIQATKSGKLDGHEFGSTINEIRGLDLTKDKEKIKRLKEGLPFILSSVLVVQGDVGNAPHRHTGKVQMDFDLDGLDQMEDRKVRSQQLKIALKDVPFVFLIFLSPTYGLKLLCEIPPDIQNHDWYLNELSLYFKKHFGITHDPNCKNVKRAMFLSYDPDIYVNHECTVFSPDRPSPTAELQSKVETQPSKNNSLVFRQIDEINKQIEQRNLDFVPEYSQYLNLGFALASLGEDARSRYHAACRFSAKYSEKDCDAQFDTCLKTYNGKVTVSTFFHYAKIHGIFYSASKSESKASPEPEQSEEDKLDLIMEETTQLPDHIFENSPEFLRSSSALFGDGRVRDLYFISAITVLSSLFYRVSGLYDNAKVFSNIYCFIIGPPASGKSVVRWAIRCLDGVIKFLSAIRAQEDAEHQATEEKDDKKPIPSAILIPGNSSIAGLIQLLSKNQAALMAETEADAVSKLFDVSFGDYSDKLRQIFHNEYIYSYRKTAKEYISIDEPKLSVLVTGTPSQIEPLVRGSSDGLFSRFCYYSFSGRPKYRSPFGSKTPLKSYFEVIAEEVLAMFRQFQETDCEFRLSDQQIEKFDAVLERWQSLAYDLHKNVGTSIVNRMGLILFKIAMVLTILRNRVPSPVMICTDQDFTNALNICEVLRVHSFTIYSVLPKSNAIKPDESRVKTEFYKSLPAEFKYSEGVALSESFHISTRQAKRYISDFAKKGLLVEGDPKKGYYKKNS